MKSSAPYAWKSLLPLLALTSIYSLGRAILAARGLPPSDGSALLWRFTFAICAVRWVALDRRSRNLSLPFEFDAFVFFAWILLVPWYLVKTRGGRGLVNAAAFCLLAVTPDVAATIASLTRHH